MARRFRGALLAAMVVAFASTAILAGEAAVFKIASTQSPDMYSTKALVKLAGYVKERSKGAIEVQVYPSSQLGDQRDYLEGVSLGTVEMCIIANSALEPFDKRYAIFGAPGLFNGSKHIRNFMNGPVGQGMFEDYRKNQGAMTVGYFDEGIRHVWLSKKEVKKLEDFKGIKLRVPEVPVYVAMFTSLGTNPTPMGWGECYTGLQTGVIEGVENNVEMVTTSSLTDYIKYQIPTGHVYSMILLLMNEQAFNALSPELQKIFRECIDQALGEAYGEFLKSQEAAYAKAYKAGVKKVEISDAEMARINEVFKQVSRKALTGLFPDTIYDAIEAAKP